MSDTGNGPREALEAIRLAEVRGDHIAAMELARKAAEDYPESAEVLALHSHFQLWRGRRDEAAAALARAVGFDPDSALVWAARADWLAFDAALPEAKEAADRAIEAGGDDWHVLTLCISVYGVTDPPSALAAARRFVETYQECDVAASAYISTLEALGSHSEAEAMLEKAERYFVDSPRMWQCRVRVLMRSGKMQDATELTQKAAEKTRGDFGMLGELAMMLEFAGRTDEAEAMARQALEISSCATVAMNTMSTICRKRGQDRQAAEWDRKAKNAIPVMRATACLREANAAARAEDHKKVVTIVDEALPDLPPANKRVALEIKARALVNLGELDQAESVLDQAKALGEVSSTHYHLRGLILASREDHTGTVALLREGLERFPLDGTIRAELLKSFHALGRFDERRALVEDTMAHLPQAPWEYTELSMALDHCGYGYESKQVRELGLERFPEDETLMAMEAVALMEAGDFEGAQRIASRLQGDMREVSGAIRRGVWFIRIVERVIGWTNRLLGKKSRGGE